MMPRRETDSKGNVVALTYTREQLMKLLRIDEQQLGEWQGVIGPAGDHYTFKPDELRRVAERVAVLRTGMSVDDVRGVEAAGLLHGYAQLAQDAPEGITAHVWRSYAILVLYQTRPKNPHALNAHELAEIAKLRELNVFTGEFEDSPELAKMHLRLLRGTRIVTEEGDSVQLLTMRDGVWEHQGLPRCLQKAKQAGKAGSH